MPVVLDDEVGRDVRIIVSITGEGREDDAMAELHVADLDGREERGGGVSGHASNRALLMKFRVSCGPSGDECKGENAPSQCLDREHTKL